MWTFMAWGTLALAVGPDDWPTGIDPRSAPKPVAPLLGMADLHVHHWAALEHGSWFHGDGSGPPTDALAACGGVDRRGRPLKTEHGRKASQCSSQRDQQPDRQADDRDAAHPPSGISGHDTLPNWLGWPTPDTTTHQQVWEGWLRLAHDGVPALWFLSEHPQYDDIHRGLEAFYGAYRRNIIDAANAGAVGVNLVVVSLSHDEVRCRAQVPKRELRADPTRCNAMDAIKRQYDAALHWAEQNREWAEVVTTPQEADNAIRDGKLAVVLSMQTSDLLGPSETIGDRVPFREGYRGHARALAGDASMVRTHVRSAIDAYLDELPKVSTLQLVHEHDSPFAGAGFFDAEAVREQAWLDARGGRAENVDGKVVACGKAAKEWKWQDFPDAPYPECEAKASTRAGRPGGGLPSAVGALLGGPHRLPTAYRKASLDEEQYRNPYGLSADGKVLVEAMMARGMPIDVADISDAAFAEVLEHIDRVDGSTDEYPVYASHAYPASANLLLRERNLDADQLADLASRDGLVGVHTGNDPIRSGGEPGPFADTLQGHDCMGTTVVAGLYQQTIGESGVRLAWGSDLNGLTGQVQPTLRLRPPTWQQVPCAVALPSIGSEVAQRGLAHAGLLPQMQMELLALADARRESGDPIPPAIRDSLKGAASYLEVWSDVWCSSESADPFWCRSRGGRTRKIEPWASWKSWLAPRGKSDELATIALDVDAAGGTPPERWGHNGWVLRSSKAGNVREFGTQPPRMSREAEPEEEGVMRLQRWRALEAVLPYVASRKADVLATPAWPQLPTTVGFLIGAHGYTANPTPASFPYRRCVDSGASGNRFDRKWECRPIRDARKRYKNARTLPMLRSSMRSPLVHWDRVYPGQRAPNVHEMSGVAAIPPVGLYALARRAVRRPRAATLYSQLQSAVQATELRSAWRDFPTYEPVATFLVGNRVCLSSGVLTAPPPGLPTGGDPVVWLDSASRLARQCYCEMIYHPTIQAALGPRERAAQQVCLNEVFEGRTLPKLP
ncbi:MAG: membrane dipeptidase [Myxococcales bacterium]|nr:membrane dipeptidase [Myxococcales bacterium]